jgi:hypothetical protein
MAAHVAHNSGDLLRRQLATLLNVAAESIGRVRTTPEGLPSLVDVIGILCKKDAKHAARSVRELKADPTMRDQLEDVLLGRYQTTIPKDLAVLAEMVPLLQWRKSQEFKAAAVDLFRRYADAVAPHHPIPPAIAQPAPAGDRQPEPVSSASHVGAAVGAAASQAGGAAAASTETSEVLAQLRQLAGEPELRLRVTDDQMVALIDVAKLFTGLARKFAAEVIRNLRARCPEVAEKLGNLRSHKFEGPGQKPTHVAPIAVAIEVAFLLPGRRAAQLRMQAARLLVRYLGGDLSLVDEIVQLRHVQQALASVPTESLNPEQQAVRACGAAVEAATPQPRLAGPPPQTEYLPAAPSCLDGGQSTDLYVLSCERGLRPGRTSMAAKDARLLCHRREYGVDAFFLLYAPKYGHVETALHRYLKPLSVEPANPRNELVAAGSISVGELKEAIQRLDAAAREEAAARLESEASHKRSREEAREELEHEAKRRRDDADAELERKLREADAEVARETLRISREAVLTTFLELAKSGNEAALSTLLKTTASMLASC